MVRILYVIDSLAIGGAQRQLLELVRRLDRQRYTIAVCPIWPQMGLVPAYEAAGVEIVRIHKRHTYDATVALRLAKKMRRFRPDIVHTWLFTGNLWGRLAAILACAPVIISSERTVAPDAEVPCRVRILNRLLTSRTDAIMANSGSGFERLARSGIPARKLRCIYNGVDTDVYAPKHHDCRRALHKDWRIESGATVIGLVGRLTKPKAQPDFLKALAAIGKNGIDVCGALIGEGPDRQALEKLAQELDISERVLFLGERSDIPQALSAMDIFALPSYWEGMPNAVLEAMAMELPVVATNVAGVPEAVEEGVTGFLVPPGDPQALAERLAMLIRDPALRVRLGKEGRSRCERLFTIGRMVAQTTALYDELLAHKQPAHA